MTCEHCWDRRLEAVTPDIWGKVLRRLGWKEHYEGMRGILWIKRDAEGQTANAIELPKSTEHGDYGRRIQEAVQTLLNVEDSLTTVRDVAELVMGFDDFMPGKPQIGNDNP